ncbi:MAG: IS1634 family transposase [Rhabdochlamydiaceae bacterium]
MPCRVHYVNKNTGVTYVYESVSYWDKDKKQARNKRVCIGKLNPSSNELILSKRQAVSPEQVALSAPTTTATAEIVGSSIVLDAISERLGLRTLLKSSFPNEYSQILTMAYYLASRGAPLSHCGTWCKSHAHPFGEPLTDQRISEVLSSITTDGKQNFLSRWMARVMKDDYLCYDITSVSSYSELNEYIKYGHNQDNEKLPQLNLAMLFGQNSGLPVYFQRMPGNVTDVTTLTNLLGTFKALELKPFNYVMDKGFYSKKNIDKLLTSKSKFTVSVPLNNKWVQHAIDEIHTAIHTPEGYRKVDEEILYVHSQLYPWGEDNRRCYLHLYYNARKRAEAVDQFNEKLVNYKKELESGKLIDEHQQAYNEFFVVKTTPKRGVKVSYNIEAVKQYISQYAGFQAILSNSIKDPVKAIQTYRDKDIVEKCFDDLKNQLDMKRLRMHSSATADGRLFVQFIALIYISALRKEMRNSVLIERYSVRELLEEMETLVKVKYSGKYGHILTEITKPQREILEKLAIELSV